MRRKDFAGITGPIEQALKGPSSESDEVRTTHLRSVQAQVDAIARGDLESVLAAADPDVQLDIFAPPEFPWIRRTRGIPELRRALQYNFASVEEQRPEITNVLAEGDAVVLFGRERGRFREMDTPYDVEFVQRFTFKEERLVSVRIIVAHTAQGQ